MRMPRTALMLIAGIALAVSTACGGDDGGGAGGGGGGSALSDEAFCARVAAFDDDDDAMFADDDAFFDDMRELRDSAPNAEVRAAMSIFVDFFDEFQDIDEDDPEALGRFFELTSSPEFQSAEQVLEDYSVNVCGFDPDE